MVVTRSLKTILPCHFRKIQRSRQEERKGTSVLNRGLKEITALVILKSKKRLSAPGLEMKTLTLWMQRVKQLKIFQNWGKTKRTKLWRSNRRRWKKSKKLKVVTAPLHIWLGTPIKTLIYLLEGTTKLCLTTMKMKLSRIILLNAVEKKKRFQSLILKLS